MRTTHRSSEGKRNEKIYRWAAIAFVTGALIPWPAALLTLSVQPVEALLPVLAPGVAVLRRLPVSTEAWPGPVSVVLTCLLNGALLGGVAGLAASSRFYRRNVAPGGKASTSA
jgi:hypothetical protein